MTISQAQVEAMDECMEFGAMHNREPLNDFHRRQFYVVVPDPVAPTEPFEDIEPEGLDVTVPVIALALFAALLAFYWLVDNGLPQLFPM